MKPGKAECAETDKETGNELGFGGGGRGSFGEEEGVREMIYSRWMIEKVRKQRWVFVRC